MTDVFISYKREDRQKAQAIAKVLAKRGYQVWWDIELLPGAKFAQEIRAIIHGAKTAVVLWSKAAVDSPYVVDEATLARECNILIPVRLDDCELPIGFGGLHTLDLKSWQGDANEATLTPLLRAIEQRVKAPQQTPISEEQTIKSLQNSAAEAQFWREISEHEPQSHAEYALYLERYGENAMFADIARLRRAQLASSSNKEKNISVTKMIAITSTVVGLVTAIFTMFSKGGELMEYFGWVNEAPVSSAPLTPAQNTQAKAAPTNNTKRQPAVNTDKPTTTPSAKTGTKPDTNPVTITKRTPAKRSSDIHQPITLRADKQDTLLPFSLREVNINLSYAQENKKQATAIKDRLKQKQLDIKMTTLYSIPSKVANKIYYSREHVQAAQWLKQTLADTVSLELVEFDAKSDSDANNIRINIGPTIPKPPGLTIH